jgi:tetratricopeptide (TPR) repeat protein
MKPVKLLQVLALLTLVPAFIVGAAGPADDFYLVRLQAGKAEAAAGRHYDAIDDFRIASFGFIDQPALLIEGLARLALVQEAAGRKEDAEATLRRLVEIERRFDGWGQAELEPETRAAFSTLLTNKLGTEAAKVLEVPVAPPAPPALPTPNPTAAPTATPTAVSTAPPTSTSAATLAESKNLVTQGRYVENLRKLVAAVAADPKDRGLRKALIEGASLTKDWGTAVAQLDLLRPFVDGEEPFMFYGAVALYESGRAVEARELAEKALPRLARSPFVDYYARRIVEGTPRR